MWVYTPEGFVSAAEDRDDPTTILVRARDWDSLAAVCDVLMLAPATWIIAYEGTDYPYRIAVSREQWVAYVTHAAQAVDYPNFKDQAHAVRGKAYADTLMRVWVANLALTPKRVAHKQREAYAARRASRAQGAWDSMLKRS